MSIPFTQTKEYLSWHEVVGTKTFYFDFFRDTSESEDFQIDKENAKEKYAIAACVVLNLRIGKVLYVPYGPVFLSPVTESENQNVINKLHELAKKENCVFVRLENSVMGEREEKIFVDRIREHLGLGQKAAEQFASRSQAESSGRKKTFLLFQPSKMTFSHEGIFQPRMEWWLNLTESEEEILNRIHKDHKYSIRRAEKENVEVEIINTNYHEYFEDFYNLMLETGERNGFGIYDRKYYEAVFNSLEKHEMKGFLAFAKIDGKLVSVALIIISEKIANFVFGASNNYKRELGANPYLQYKCILESKKHGCEIYNFGGITENGYGKKSLEDLTKYKKKFGGYAKFHGDFVDMPINKIKYFLYILRKLF